MSGSAPKGNANFYPELKSRVVNTQPVKEEEEKK
jgi:hypothetical protein